MATAGTDERTLLDSAFEGRAWRDVAPGAGRVGRWIWLVDKAECEIDRTLTEICGLDTPRGRIAADLFLGNIHADDMPAVRLAAESALAGGEYRVQFRYARPDGGTIWLAGHGQAATLESGERVLLGVNYETTHLQREIERSSLLAAEMAHRIKNLLSLVTSIFNMAARSAESVEALTEAFNGRIMALAALNGLIFAGDRERVALGALAEAVLAPLDADRRIARDLPEGVSLNGTAAQTVTLLLNELMTNAVKHGALSARDGRVALRVTIGPEAFVLTWTETGAGPVAPPTKSGFGLRVLQGMTSATFGGRPTLDWRQDGLAFSCRWRAADMTA